MKAKTVSTAVAGVFVCFVLSTVCLAQSQSKDYRDGGISV
jgi:hypothetical protein